MNTVHIELNSYTGEVRFFLNGIQTDPYSALSNFTYERVLENPKEILEAVARELNDDFQLELTATQWAFMKFEDAAVEFEDCNSCSIRQPSINLTSRERAEKLGEHLAPQTITVLVPGNPPQTRTYGNLTLCFTNEPSLDTHRELMEEQDIVSAAETLLINPLIGRSAKRAAAADSSFSVCHSLSPVLTVSLPKSIPAGDQAQVCVSVFPDGAPVPPVTVRSSNPDVASVLGTVIHAHNSGIANIQVFLPGENTPLYSRKILVEKKVYVSRIEIPRLDRPLPEGQIIDLDMAVFPPDATDAASLTCHSSAPDIAQFIENRLKLHKAGECEILITGKNVCYRKTIQVSARLQEYILSADHVELNLGQKYPIDVQCVPERCYNSAYTWITSDKTVAIVVEEDGLQYIKAIGMGSCVITCQSTDQSITSACTATVKSAMYQKKTLADYKKNAAALFGFARDFTSSAKKLIEDVSEKVETAYVKRTTPLDAFADMEYQFSGENGGGTIRIINNSQHPFLKACIYTACPARELTNGQQVTIIVGTNAASQKYPGYNLEDANLTVTVSGLAELPDM